MGDLLSLNEKILSFNAFIKIDHSRMKLTVLCNLFMIIIRIYKCMANMQLGHRKLSGNKNLFLFCISLVIMVITLLYLLPMKFLRLILTKVSRYFYTIPSWPTY